MNDKELKTITLNRINIIEKETTYNKVYYIIFDQEKDSDNAYFCFRGDDNLNHEDFERLSNEWMTIKDGKIQLTYFESEYQGRRNKKVVSFKLPV